MTFHVYECGEGAREVPYSEIWDYDAQPKEWPDYCNLCGATVLANPVQRDRYGYAVRVCACRCGLVFLTPRMTREAYARFYETAYRPLVSAFHGREINAQTIQPEQLDYAVQLGDWLDSHVMCSEAETLLDVGGSTGVVARLLSDRFSLKATVIDPCVTELRAAQGTGRLSVVLGTIEEWDAEERRFDIITLCQTADHLLDLMGSLRKIKSLLSQDGLFWSDIVNFDVTREVKIDHPFNLTERTYRKFLEKAGFKLLQINYAPDGKHIGFLAR